MPSKRSHKSHKRAPGHVQQCHSLNRCSTKGMADCQQDEHCLWLKKRGCQSKPGHRAFNPFMNPMKSSISSDDSDSSSDMSDMSTPESESTGASLLFRSKRSDKKAKRSAKKSGKKAKRSAKKSAKKSGKKAKRSAKKSGKKAKRSGKKAKKSAKKH